MIFFNKTMYLADLLEGVVDIHNHVLPGIDDGAPDLAVTKTMITAFQELGFKGAYTTPHTMVDYYGNDVEAITDCFKETKKSLTEKHSSFLWGTASEYMMDGGFAALLENANYLTLPNHHLLFEFSYFQKPVEAEQLIFEMGHKELKPLLAHPERYRYLSTSEIMDLKNRGCELQLNLLSLSGHYGKEAKKKATQLLEINAYTFLGTDAHHPKHLELIRELKISKRQYEQLKQVVDSHQSNLD
jgi:protein-tyrosine phosphatase